MIIAALLRASQMVRGDIEIFFIHNGNFFLADFLIYLLSLIPLVVPESSQGDHTQYFSIICLSTSRLLVPFYDQTSSTTPSETSYQFTQSADFSSTKLATAICTRRYIWSWGPDLWQAIVPISFETQ